MSRNVSPTTNPTLHELAKRFSEWYELEGKYVSKRQIEDDFHRDSLYVNVLAEAGIIHGHENEQRTFRSLVWPVIRTYMKPATGWWAKSRGASSQFFHESFGTPEDGRDAINLHLKDKQKDAASLKRLCQYTETRCGQLGWVFDPQFSDEGELVGVEVWAKPSA